MSVVSMQYRARAARGDNTEGFMAVLTGEFFGALLALGGVAYIWLGALWVMRVYKRWPRFSYWSAAAAAALVGAVTAVNSGQPILYAIVTIAVCVFIVIRERRALRATTER